MIPVVVTCTYRREPRFDWLADSLARQVAARPAIWIVVDGYLWHEPDERRRKLDAAVRNRFPILHVPPKPCRWQGPARYTSSDWFALSNARNTALVVAPAGAHLVFTDDCAVLDENWLARHAYWAARGLGTAGSYDAYFASEVRDGVVVGGRPFGDGDGRKKIMPAGGRAHVGWAYGLNMSVPLATAVAVGGWDEMYDGQAGSEDCCFAVRAERSGLAFQYDPTCFVHQVLDSHDVVCADETRPKRPNKTAVLRADGIAHFCNEALIERLLLDDPARTRPLATWFDPMRARETYRQTGRVDQFDLGPTTYWLDGEPLSEMR